jgi:hypothetical protein
MQMQVTVLGQVQTIDIWQRSRTVWVARGEYMGGTIEQIASSSRMAAARWRRRAAASTDERSRLG